ncbi:hypothetical protein AB3S75_015357 [Citrus x aurantiifolia]
MAQYYVSVVDLETESCFLHFQEIRASPRNMHHPRVDFLVSGQPTQSVSLYVCSWSEEPAGKNKPRLGMPRIYLLMQWTADRWRCRGACMNLLTMWTT